MGIKSAAWDSNEGPAQNGQGLQASCRTSEAAADIDPHQESGSLMVARDPRHLLAKASSRAQTIPWLLADGSFRAYLLSRHFADGHALLRQTDQICCQRVRSCASPDGSTYCICILHKHGALSHAHVSIQSTCMLTGRRRTWTSCKISAAERQACCLQDHVCPVLPQHGRTKQITQITLFGKW